MTASGEIALERYANEWLCEWTAVLVGKDMGWDVSNAKSARNRDFVGNSEVDMAIVTFIVECLESHAKSPLPADDSTDDDDDGEVADVKPPTAQSEPNHLVPVTGTI